MQPLAGCVGTVEEVRIISGEDDCNNGRPPASPFSTRSLDPGDIDCSGSVFGLSSMNMAKKKV